MLFLKLNCDELFGLPRIAVLFENHLGGDSVNTDTF